jgi:hypothetical protein
MLGLKEYPVGKPIQEAWQDAPLKGIIHPYVGDTGWHK